jgi:hypothetical protein
LGVALQGFHCGEYFSQQLLFDLQKALFKFTFDLFVLFLSPRKGFEFFHDFGSGKESFLAHVFVGVLDSLCEEKVQQFELFG